MGDQIKEPDYLQRDKLDFNLAAKRSLCVCVCTQEEGKAVRVCSNVNSVTN